jgi:hypothetical protein
MRVVRHAKPVSVVAGGVLVIAGCLGAWLAARVQAGQEDVRLVAFTVLFAAAAVIQGVVILSWDRRSKPMALMRAQAADTLPVLLPVAVSVPVIISVPDVADPGNPALWLAGLFLVSVAISVVPAEKAALSEVPPLRSVGFLNWLRWQDFGAGTLLLSIFLTVTHFLSYPPPPGAFTPLIVVLALVQATVSVWRIMEHHQFSRAGVRLSGLQISWLRVIHVSRGHEAAAKELRAMYPKTSAMQADTIIENLYQAKEEH